MRSQNNPPYMGHAGRPSAPDGHTSHGNMGARTPNIESHAGFAHLPPEHDHNSPSANPTAGQAEGEGGNGAISHEDLTKVVRGPDPRMSHQHPPAVHAADSEAQATMDHPIGLQVGPEYAGRLRL